MATLAVIPSKDNTLFQSSAGSVSDGAGTGMAFGLDHFDNLAMRGLMAFNLSQIPTGSTINSVSLNVWVNLTFSNSTPTVELHKVTTDWGEGASAPSGFMPPYGTAKTNDATWTNTFFPNGHWTTQGGDFSSTVSGSTVIGADNAAYTWQSTAGMVADVQSWVNNPSNNFGWLIKGNETQESGKLIDTRESTTASHRPTLTIDYTPPAAASDLTLSKSHVGNFRLGDVSKDYTLLATNTGSGPTVGTVTIIDNVPAGLSAVSATGNGWTTSILGSTVTATRSDVLAGGNSYPALTVTVGVASTAPSTVTNVAQISGGGELNTANDSASDITLIAGIADLTINKSHTATFQQGDVADAYSITISNGGAGPTLGSVTVTDNLPSGLIANSASGTGWTTQIQGSTITATRSDVITSGASYPVLTIVVGVASNAPSSITNIATVAGGGESNFANDSASDVTSIASAADLTIQASHSDTFRQGDTGKNLILTVQNAGTSSTHGTVTVTSTLPQGLTATAANGTGWTTSIQGQTITATRNDSLAGGAAYPAITITNNVSNNAVASMSNNASVSGGSELNTDNDTATDAIAVVQAADLTLQKTHAGSFQQGNGNAQYTLTVNNVGGGGTQGLITLIDTLPTGLSYVSAVGTGWSVTALNGTVTATRSDALAINTSFAPLVITVSVAANAPLSITNTASVSGGGEVITVNDSASDPTVVTVAASDLSIQKSHAGSFRQGDTNDIYTLRIKNEGSLATSGLITVTDVVPAGLSITSASGTGWTTSIVGSTLTATRSDVIAVDNFAPDLTMAVNVASDAPASITNTASVSGGSELDTANDSASDVTSVIQNTDLTVTSSHVDSFRQGDSADNYTITVHNAGAGASSGLVTVTDTIPTGMTPTSANGTGWTTSISGNMVTATRSDSLASNASYPGLTITSNVRNDAPSTLVNNLTISGGGDVNTANNSANDSTIITQAPDLSVMLNHTGPFNQGDSGKIVNLVVSNAANTSATQGAVTITATIPSGLTATAASGSGWTANINGTSITATRNDSLSAGSSYPALSVTVNVASTAATPLSVAGQVSGGSQLNTANDSGTDSIAVIPVADLTITSSHTGSFKKGDTNDSYSVVVSNIGGAATAGQVTVTDTLPAGLTYVSASGTGWTVNANGSTITASRSDALAAAVNASTPSSYPALSIVVGVSTTASPSISNFVTVSGGGESNAANDTSTDVTTIIALASASISGYAYLDASNAGTRSGANGTFMHGVSAVTVALELQDAQGNWSAVSGKSPIQTDSNGFYQFNGLIAGSYRISVTVPTIFMSGIISPGLVSGTTKGTATQNQISVALRSGEVGTEYDFAFRGMKPTVVSRRWSLASTGTIDQVLAELYGGS